ncbi:MAG TPA: LemA family protein [Victivallales bacterium]|nr:LemA family protein [Victivallales bacterium]HRR06466.1 LemA family protein [Victivallales bacterium]HRR27883.1 LemA family protein [Victivallales bacterium]
MSIALIILLVIVGIVILFILFFLATYNSMVALRNQAKNAWAQIDVQLKRRHDLIPNLVETVKGYAKHEKETLDAVIKARNAAVNASGVGNQAKAEGELSGVLSRLFALAEAYPDLKANQNFLALQEELSSTENKISFARQAYNDAVMIYNTKIQMIPANIIAGISGFTPMELFELKDESQRSAPQVKF